MGLIVLFFFSTTGVTVYKHYCHHDGVFYNYFVDVEHDCEPEELVAQEVQHDCCIPLTNHDEESVHDDCCEDDVTFYQIDSDLIVQQDSGNWITHLMVVENTPTTPVLVANHSIQQPTANSPPFILKTPTRLALIQVYTI